MIEINMYFDSQFTDFDGFKNAILNDIENHGGEIISDNIERPISNLKILNVKYLVNEIINTSDTVEVIKEESFGFYD